MGPVHGGKIDCVGPETPVDPVHCPGQVIEPILAVKQRRRVAVAGRQAAKRHAYFQGASARLVPPHLMERSQQRKRVGARRRKCPVKFPLGTVQK